MWLPPARSAAKQGRAARRDDMHAENLSEEAEALGCLPTRRRLRSDFSSASCVDAKRATSLPVASRLGLSSRFRLFHLMGSGTLRAPGLPALFVRTCLLLLSPELSSSLRGVSAE